MPLLCRQTGHSRPWLPLPCCCGPGQAAPGAAGAGSLRGRGSRSCSLVHPVTGTVWLCSGARGEMCPACFQTFLLLVVSWLQSGSKEINRNPAGLSKPPHTRL